MFSNPRGVLRNKPFGDSFFSTEDAKEQQTEGYIHTAFNKSYNRRIYVQFKSTCYYLTQFNW